MTIPSKELLSEVLSKEVEEERFIDSNSLTYVNSGIYEDINIYELAHQCKEWAYEKGYKLASFPSGKDWYVCRDSYKEPYEGDNTEPEAIFKACEWIMEQTKCGS